MIPAEEELQAMGFVPPTPAIKEAAKKLLEGDVEAPKEVEPSTDEQEFLVHVLGGKPFQKVFSYFNGSVLLTMRSLTPVDEEICSRAIAKLVNEPSLDQLRIYREYRMLFAVHLVEIKGKPPMPLHPPEGTVDIEAYRLATLKSLNGPVYGLISDAYAKFQTIYGSLMDKAADPSF